MLNLKLTKAIYFNESTKEKENDLIDAVNDGEWHKVKLTTNRLDIQLDKKDERKITSINGIKIIYRIAKGGCLVLIGNLGCSFRAPFGGEFFVKRAVVEENSDFDSIKGVDEEITFSNTPVVIEFMQEKLATISKKRELVYDLSQFDEFMEIFKFYKSYKKIFFIGGFKRIQRKTFKIKRAA